MHFSNFTMITQRVSLSIAIIAMVNSTQQHGLPNASTEGPLADTLNNPSRSMKEFNTGVSIMENEALCREGKPSLKGRILILPTYISSVLHVNIRDVSILPVLLRRCSSSVEKKNF